MPPIPIVPVLKKSNKPSDLELSIRKEVMDAVEELIDRSGPNTYLERRVGELGAILQDRLNLLWGSND